MAGNQLGVLPCKTQAPPKRTQTSFYHEGIQTKYKYRQPLWSKESPTAFPRKKSRRSRRKSKTYSVTRWTSTTPSRVAAGAGKGNRSLILNLMNCLKTATTLKALKSQAFLRNIDSKVHNSQHHGIKGINSNQKEQIQGKDKTRPQDPHKLLKGEACSGLYLRRRWRHCQAKAKRGYLSLAEANHFQGIAIFIKTSLAL